MHCTRGCHLAVFTHILLSGKSYYEVFDLVIFKALVAFKLYKRKNASVACVGPTKKTADQFSHISIEYVVGQLFLSVVQIERMKLSSLI